MTSERWSGGCLVYDPRVAADLETRVPAPLDMGSTAPTSRWVTIVWPTWLPVRARLPLIAQIAGASALMAAIAMPRWSEVAKTPNVAKSAGVAAAPAVAPALAVPAAVVPETPAVAEMPARPAHLNLDVRHAFRSADLSITVDGKRVFDTRLDGSAKRFKVFGKRAEKGFTRSLDLSPGVRVVHVRLRSTSDKFDQTRVERFDLDPASVAGMRIAADKSGLAVFADRPLVYDRTPATPIAQAQVQAQAQPASALAELYQTLRAVLIAVAGVVASAATGVFVQEFLKSRRSLMGL